MTYLALIGQTADGYAALIPELTVLATAPTLDSVKEALSQGLALHLLAAEAQLPRPRVRRLSDFPEAVQEAYRGRPVEAFPVAPAPINPVSVQVGRAIAASGLSYREVARRMDTAQPALVQMANPFYWDHTVAALRQLASVLDLTLDLNFVSAVELPEGAILGPPWGGLTTPRLRVRTVPEVANAELPLTVRSELGTFRLNRECEAEGQPHSAESVIYEAWELR